MLNHTKTSNITIFCRFFSAKNNVFWRRKGLTGDCQRRAGSWLRSARRGPVGTSPGVLLLRSPLPTSNGIYDGLMGFYSDSMEY